MIAHDASEPTAVGYWSRSPDDTALPYPQTNAAAWQRQAQFVARLQAIEQGVRERRHGKLIGYRGFSMCRLCGIPNGSEEVVWGGFRWPSGLLHYVEAHNVRLPDAFVDAVLKSEA